VILKASPDLSPEKSHEICKIVCKYTPVQQIGVHVGNLRGKNYSTMFHENLFLDFILPTIQRFHLQHGKGTRENDYNKEYKILCD